MDQANFIAFGNKTMTLCRPQAPFPFTCSLTCPYILYDNWQYSTLDVLTWLRGFRVKIANFQPLHCLAIPRRDLNTKNIKPNVEKWPESLEVMIEFWYIERGLSPRVAGATFCARVWHNDKQKREALSKY